MKTNTHAKRYLQKLGHSWYVRVKVPTRLQPLVGNTHVRKALGTRDLDKANELKWGYVNAIKKSFVRLAKGPVPEGRADPLAGEAKRYRETLNELRQLGQEESVQLHHELAADRARQIEDESGDEKRAQDWFALATANTPLLSELMDEWLEGEHYKEQTKRQHRAALDNLLAFLGGDKLPVGVNADVAADFVEEWLKRSGQSYNTQRRKLNSLVSFWKWLSLRRYVERGFNPWTGFVLSKARTPKKTPDKRPYKEEELLKLFANRPDYDGLADLMVLGLYTGARIEELCSLRIKDVERKQGTFFLTLQTGKGKTKTRVIAVERPAPSAVLIGRWRGRNTDPDAQLFRSFKPGGYDGKLSWAVSKAFGRFRDAVGLPRDVDFHSFRRTLITALENLEVDQVAIARYVGHTLDTLAFTVYSGGSTLETSRKIARTIRYSTSVERAVESFVAATAQRAVRAA